MTKKARINTLTLETQSKGLESKKGRCQERHVNERNRCSVSLRYLNCPYNSFDDTWVNF